MKINDFVIRFANVNGTGSASANALGDPLYIDFYDPDHSIDEDRYLIIGTSTAGRLLIVSYTEREGVVRLISVREVTLAERKAYEEG